MNKIVTFIVTAFIFFFNLSFAVTVNQNSCLRYYVSRSTTLKLDNDLIVTGQLGVLQPASSTSFSAQTASYTMFFLAERGALLQQDDPYLFQTGIALPAPFGICGPTCATNILVTTANYKQIPPPGNNYEIVNYFVNEYSRVFGVDARKNTDPERLSRVIVGAQPVQGLKYEIIGKVNSAQKINDLISKNPSTLALTQIGIDGFTNMHWIVVLALDLAQKRIIISDPNRPNSTFSSPYIEQDGNLKFQLFGNYGGLGTAYIKNVILFTSN